MKLINYIVLFTMIFSKINCMEKVDESKLDYYQKKMVICDNLEELSKKPLTLIYDIENGIDYVPIMLKFKPQGFTKSDIKNYILSLKNEKRLSKAVINEDGSVQKPVDVDKKDVERIEQFFNNNEVYCSKSLTKYNYMQLYFYIIDDEDNKCTFRDLICFKTAGEDNDLENIDSAYYGFDDDEKKNKLRKVIEEIYDEVVNKKTTFNDLLTLLKTKEVTDEEDGSKIKFDSNAQFKIYVEYQENNDSFDRLYYEIKGENLNKPLWSYFSGTVIVQLPKYYTNKDNVITSQEDLRPEKLKKELLSPLNNDTTGSGNTNTGPKKTTGSGNINTGPKKKSFCCC